MWEYNEDSLNIKKKKKLGNNSTFMHSFFFFNKYIDMSQQS